MKFVLILLLLGLIVVGALYADRRGFVRLPEVPWSSQPEVRVELPPALRQLSPDQKLTTALTLLREGKSELGLELYHTVVQTAGNPEIEAEALFLWASAVGQSLNQPDRAREIYQRLATVYPRSRFADNAHYSLGILSFEAGDLRQAVYHFTYLIENYPQSERLEDAKLMARNVSQRLVEGWHGRTQINLPLSVLIGFLPNNLLSLLLLLTAVGGPLVWLLLGYLESPQRREILTRSTITKVMLVLFVVFTITNHLLNQHQNRRESQQLRELLRRSGIDVSSSR
jgi:tetratricopeptide (TPR) repeat protein